MKNVTIKDIASAANVSTATVSRMLHSNGYVSPDTRERIRQVLNELDYKLSPAAGNISAAETPTVLCFIPSVTANFLFSQILENLIIKTQKKGWHLQPCYTSNLDPDKVSAIIDSCGSTALNAIVFCCIAETYDFMPLRKYLQNSAVPVIMVERAPNIFGLNRVMVNAREMIFQAVHHLYSKGHRRIVFFAADHHMEYGVEYERMLGFREAVGMMKIADTCDIVTIPEWDMHHGYEAMQAYLGTKKPLPSAVISADHTLVGVLQSLTQAHLSVPDDISLIGLDDTYSPFCAPPLTTVAFPVDEICDNVVRIIETYQQENPLPQSVLLSCKIIERESVLSLNGK